MTLANLKVEATASVVQKHADFLKALREQWELTDRSQVRTGTSCKCGANVSTRWEDGGDEWLEDHILEHHSIGAERYAHLAEISLILPADQDTFTPEEVMGLLGDQRQLIARKIRGEE